MELPHFVVLLFPQTYHWKCCCAASLTLKLWLVSCSIFCICTKARLDRIILLFCDTPAKRHLVLTLNPASRAFTKPTSLVSGRGV